MTTILLQTLLYYQKIVISGVQAKLKVWYLLIIAYVKKKCYDFLILYLKAKEAKHRVKVSSARLHALEKQLKATRTGSAEYYNLELVEIPKAKKVLSWRIKSYRKIFFIKQINKISYYFVVWAFIREYFTYLLLHLYICLFVLSFFLKNMVIFITYANYTGGFVERFLVALLLILLGLSILPSDNQKIYDVLTGLFLSIKLVKVWIGIIAFRHFCYGEPLLKILLSNFLFSFSVESIFTVGYGLPKPVELNLPVEEILPIIFDIPNIYF